MPPPAGAKGASFLGARHARRGAGFEGPPPGVFAPAARLPGGERERDFLFNRGGGWERDNTCRAARGRTANGTPHVGGEELFRSVRVNGEEYAFGSCVSVLFDERGDPPMRWMICLPFG